MADNENNEKACELIRNIIDERPAQIEYFNSLSRDQLLETLDLEIQIFNNMVTEAKTTKKQSEKK